MSEINLSMNGFNENNEKGGVRVPISQLASGSKFTSSSYGSASIPTSTTVVSETTPTGATSMDLGNFSTTAAEYIIYEFGETPADAETNLASGGQVLFATGDKLATPINIPRAAQDQGGFAYKSASGTPSMYKKYGV